MNNAGQVVVNKSTAGAFSVSLWNRLGGAQSLGLSGTHNIGVALNGSSDVAGTGDPNGNGMLQAFLWRANGTLDWLGTFGGSLSAATSVNAGRNVVGMAYTAAESPHPFLWTETGGLQDLTPNSTSVGGGTAMGVNSSGEVVGYYYPDGASNVVGFSWTQAGGLQNFGAPGTLAMAVNDAGTIVGQELTSTGYRHAFMMTAGGAMTDLGTLGGSMSTAMAINNKGWIVGTSLSNDGKGLLHGFLWTPTGGMQRLQRGFDNG